LDKAPAATLLDERTSARPDRANPLVKVFLLQRDHDFKVNR
jgi:hypothetical protein